MPNRILHVTHQSGTVGMMIRTPVRETLLVRTDEFVSEIDSDQQDHDYVRIIFAVSSGGKADPSELLSVSRS